MTTNPGTEAPVTREPMVDFLIVGTQKGGTTALDRYLRQHREIGMATRKELHFFDNEGIFKKNREVSYAKLEGAFDTADEQKIYGESTPIYMYWEPCMRRIREYNPGIKLIACLRNPASRAFSHWNMEFDRGAETHDFMHCVQHEQERIGAPLSREQRVFSYVDRGFYAPQLRRIFEHFPREQTLFLKYESFREEQERHLNEIFDFLGVDAQKYKFRPKRAHERNYARRIDPAEKKYLVDVYREDICEVESLLGWNCEDWKTA